MNSDSRGGSSGEPMPAGRQRGSRTEGMGNIGTTPLRDDAEAATSAKVKHFAAGCPAGASHSNGRSPPRRKEATA
jgi:hypothetical protein